MSASAARLAALEVVTRVRERDAYAHETLDAVMSGSKLERRDVAFATRLAYGTIACRGTVDEAVRKHLTSPDRLEPAISDVLAVAAYELLFMRTPARAAVNEGVELARHIKQSTAGLANAVLRKVAAEAKDFPWGDPSTDDEALARLHGHPLWLASLWIEQLGREQAAAVMAANNEPAPLFLAPVDPSLAVDAALELIIAADPEASVCALERCIVAPNAHAALGADAVTSRVVAVVDAGAQYAAAAVPLPASGTVAELGAGRGTKTLLMAARAASTGQDVNLVGIDTHQFKLDHLDRDAARLGYSNVSTVVADASDATQPFEFGDADAVLVDAPCTGLGTLRRHPDRRWRAKPEEIDSVAALGERMLRTASSLVSPGGFVVYSTCTITQRENADVVRAFLGSAEGAEFSLDPLLDEVPESWRHFVAPEGWFQSLPEPGGPDGHFVARLVRAKDSR